MVACIPNEVLIEGVSDSNGTGKTYQRSRQFKLRAVIYSVCGEANLLVKTVTQWSAVPQSASGNGTGQGNATAPVNATARSSGGTAATTITFPTTSKELVVPSNTLQYGTYDINTVVVRITYTVATKLLYIIPGRLVYCTGKLCCVSQSAPAHLVFTLTPRQSTNQRKLLASYFSGHSVE